MKPHSSHIGMRINRHHPCFTVLISTLGNRVCHARRTVRQHPELHFLVVHQGREPDECCKELQDLPNCQYRFTTTTGLALSRNIGIQHCLSPFLLVSDDDVDFPPDLKDRLDALITAQKALSATAAFIGKAITPAGHDFQRYRPIRHLGALGFFRVASIEMLLNVDFLRTQGIRFDTNFGLGSGHPSGEELILLSDIDRSGGNIRYVDDVFSIHPPESSGDKLLTDPRVGRTKGAMIRRAFGLWPGLLFLLLFVARVWLKPSMRHRMAFTREILRGYKA